MQNPVNPDHETDARIVVTAPITTAVIRRDDIPMSELTSFYDEAFGEVSRAILAQGRRHATAGFGRYFGEPGETVDLEVGFGTDAQIDQDGDVRPGHIPGGEAAQVTYVGGYEGLGAAWGRLYEWIMSQGRTPKDWMWEEYVTMPTPDTDPASIRTVLTWPLADGEVSPATDTPE